MDFKQLIEEKNLVVEMIEHMGKTEVDNLIASDSSIADILNNSKIWEILFQKNLKMSLKDAYFMMRNTRSETNSRVFPTDVLWRMGEGEKVWVMEDENLEVCYHLMAPEDVFKFVVDRLGVSFVKELTKTPIGPVIVTNDGTNYISIQGTPKMMEVYLNWKL